MNSDDPSVNPSVNIKKLLSNRFIEEVHQGQFEGRDDILFQDSFVKKIKEGDVVEGVITRINSNDIVVDVGLKSDGRIPIKELGYSDRIAVGSKIRVYVERIEDYHGNVSLSREKAIRDEKWHRLEESAATQTEVSGVIKRSIKCGFVVDLGDGISAFLPLSHVDLKQVRDTKHLIDTEQKFIVLKVDKKQGNIVVSRKLVLEKLHAGEKIKFLESLSEGDVIEGRIKSITHYGVFVGIHESDAVGIVDGLLHITDISWSRVSHPSAIFTCGQSIKVKVIKIDKENAKVSLGMKQLEDNPWYDIESKYPVDGVHKGHVTSIEDYGVFVELKPGIEGLVHSSEITWVKNNLPVSNFVARGQEVSVKILSVDTVKNRMSLSMKRCVDNPWQIFTNKYPPGSIVSGRVKSNTGLYMSIVFDDCEIDENVEGVIYAQDISWSRNGLEQIKKYNINDIIKAKVIRVNVSRARIYLGIKQIEYDPLVELIKKVKIGDRMKAIVSKKEDNGLIVEIENNVALSVSQEHLSENRRFSISEKVEVEVLGIEAYNIILSAE
ncbi:30S ribosomal protein S1 [Wolbachia endosymbiont of Cruorifilaria tuberocauda]|uniref:30S ribosomal protein S1 n=1 Tax=Wolbachia endosymbiont of Cruorifilaria tuberocauda TaxID=1812111 RepID=UPI001589CDA2|nr:30S ribosomal protein S1 [Wolbachia endosymbiont of Cruorifilaria tuberocauda]QKX01504.1 30S ribosomal protein S1 [Wolbachia endosymbiont of Cruorifilaria tuberocauda]